MIKQRSAEQTNSMPFHRLPLQFKLEDASATSPPPVANNVDQALQKKITSSKCLRIRGDVHDHFILIFYFDYSQRISIQDRLQLQFPPYCWHRQRACRRAAKMSPPVRSRSSWRNCAVTRIKVRIRQWKSASNRADPWLFLTDFQKMRKIMTEAVVRLHKLWSKEDVDLSDGQPASAMLAERRMKANDRSRRSMAKRWVDSIIFICIMWRHIGKWLMYRRER